MASKANRFINQVGLLRDDKAINVICSSKTDFISKIENFGKVG